MKHGEKIWWYLHVKKNHLIFRTKKILNIKSYWLDQLYYLPEWKIVNIIAQVTNFLFSIFLVLKIRWFFFLHMQISSNFSFKTKSREKWSARWNYFRSSGMKLTLLPSMISIVVSLYTILCVHDTNTQNSDFYTFCNWSKSSWGVIYHKHTIITNEYIFHNYTAKVKFI